MSKRLLSGIKNIVVVLIILALLLPVVFAADVSLGQVGTITLSFQQPPAGTVSVGDTVTMTVQASGYDLVKPIARVIIDKLVYDTTKLRFLGLRNGDGSEMCGGAAFQCVLPPPAYFQFLNPDGKLPVTWYPMSVANPLAPLINVLRITASSTTVDPADYFSAGQHTLFILAFEAIADGQATVSADASTLIKLRPSLAESYTPLRVVPGSITISPACGNGRTEPDKGEECDREAANNNAGPCNTDCKLTYCGDGTVQKLNGDANGDSVADAGLAEQCDDGNNIESGIGAKGVLDTCTSSCKLDTDADKVIDDVDNCQITSNTQQENFDGDGQGDACDDDDDNDGLTDVDEAQRGTNSLNVDTDADRLGDKLEVDTLTNPISNDSDRDGLTDDVEDVSLNGIVDAGETDPRLADTDVDGINDALETDNGQRIDTDRDGTIDALDVDSDDDGVDDQTETAADADADGTPNYRDEDSDNDGLSDGFEVAGIFHSEVNGVFGYFPHDYVTRTDPLKADTDGDGLCDGAAQVNGVPVVGCQGSEDKDTDGRFEQNDNDPADYLDDETNPLVPDTDADGFCDGPVIPAAGGCLLTNNKPDTCPSVPNASQDDTDGDNTERCNVAGFCGNACDPDDDNDRLNDGATDNCQFVANADQADFDGDKVGDACDPDVDGDGVNNEPDLCEFTPLFGANGHELIRTITNELVQQNGCMVGDMNNDGCVNNVDIDTIIQYIESNSLLDDVQLAKFISKIYQNWQIGANCVDGLEPTVTVLPGIREGDYGLGNIKTGAGASVYNNVLNRDLVERGQSYLIDIIADPPANVDKNLVAYIPVSYDPLLVTINSVTAGPNVRVWGRHPFIQPNNIDLIAYTLPDQSLGLSEGTTFAVATFTPLQVAGQRHAEAQTTFTPPVDAVRFFNLNGDFFGEGQSLPHLFTVAPTRWCEDTDNGDNPAVSGITTIEEPLGPDANPQENMDVCLGDNVSEYYCEGTQLTSGVKGCNVGLVCLDSAAGAACITDTDDDGVPDQEFAAGHPPKDADNCPNNQNADQTNTDKNFENGDELGDACDDDDDNDGVTDAAEVELGTNPLLQDTDGDLRGDNDDNCPIIPNGNQLNNDEDVEICPTCSSFDSSGDECDDDDDNDQVPDAAEVAEACRVIPDCDNDTVLDKDEVAAVCVQDTDCDNDNLTDAEEVGQGTGVQNPDSDADGLNDGLEVTTGTNPLAADTDGDGLKDGGPAGEDRNANGVVDVGELDPRNRDTDGDGLDDLARVDNCPLVANPFDVDTNNDGVFDKQRDTERDGQGDACDTDDDNDGVIDEQDNCPFIQNNLPGRDPQKDSDSDGKGDACDICANDPNDDQDGDGYCVGAGFFAIEKTGGNDNCPTNANPLQENFDGDAQGDICDDDADGDTVPNADEVEAKCILDRDCDDDTIEDPTEVVLFCSNKEDCDGDQVRDPDEAVGCIQKPDCDDDDLGDDAERTAGTDPKVFDTDVDGSTDGAEVNTHGTDPLDNDSDDDGLLDGVETKTTIFIDAQNTGTDPLVQDSDIDQLLDGAEVLTHQTSPVNNDTDADDLTDGDEVQRGTDPNDNDSDDDEVHDGVEVNLGTNPTNRDSDGDGITDLIETNNNGSAVDTDGNGTIDALETDSDADGILDAIEGAVDGPDQDSLHNYRDTDSDDDGILDKTEGADADHNNNGTPNYLDLDSDGDGITDKIETAVDHDSDGQGNYIDTESDGDLISDATETADDHDGDGVANYLDDDSDGDTLSDNDEDANDNGLVDANETHPYNPNTDGDLGADGAPVNDNLDAFPLDRAEWEDTEPGGGDGVGNNRDNCDEVQNADQANNEGDDQGDACDDDDDNDGIPDDDEPAKGTDPKKADTDVDTVSDLTDNCPVTSNQAQTNTDSSCDGVQCTADELGDACDDDKDGDELPNTVESGTRIFVDRQRTGTDQLKADSDADGLSDSIELSNAEEYLRFRTDPNVIDSDGDGLCDGRPAAVIQRCTGFEDENNDGVVDTDAGGVLLETDSTKPDSDGDGLADGIEDANRDGIYDAATETNPRIQDSDSDSITDGIEDANRNGRVDAGETDPRKASTDGDVVNDDTDNCRFVSNDEQLNTDGAADGGDACDDNDDDDVNSDATDCAPTDGTIHTTVTQYADSDSDGIRDTTQAVQACTDGTAENLFVREANGPDNCVGVANSGQENFDGDAQGDACDDDDDNDTILDVNEVAPECILDTDCDDDTISDSQEVDPLCLTNVDCDGDTIRDNTEVARECINNPDCDGDTVRDNDEVARECIQKPDCDGDTIADNDEIAQGTSPVTKDSDSDQVDDNLDCAPLDRTIHTTVVQYADADGDTIREDEVVVEACTNGQAQALFVLTANGPDNCPAVANADQRNTDAACDGVQCTADEFGDACDDDKDGDGIAAAEETGLGTNDLLLDSDTDQMNDPEDNCPALANADQVDLDLDEEGNACDADDDDDGVTDDRDNCPLGDGDEEYVVDEEHDLNTNALDTDGDRKGDLCDSDLDGDTVNNEQDNCPLTANRDQANIDRDAQGSVCDVCPSDPTNDGDGDKVCEGREAREGYTANDNCPAVANGDANVAGACLEENGEVQAVLCNQIDFDKDTQGDACDPDDENDSLTDVVEAQLGTNRLSADTDDDSILDLVETDNGQAVDTDSDGTIDALDTDSDADGVNDQTEGTEDRFRDGTPDYRDPDDDHDGIETLTETTADRDGDGTANYLDTDSDGDEITDEIETAADHDNDGTGNYLDEDSDADGILDRMETIADPDGDGVANYLDDDSDGDTVSDAIEGEKDSDTDGTVDYLDTDDDNDQVLTALEEQVDTDNDGQLNYLDIDSDNDDLTDGVEDANNDGVKQDDETDRLDADTDDDELDDGVEDANKNGAVDAGETDPRKADTDADDLTDGDEVQRGTNPLVVDSDNDQLTDGAEVNTHQTNPLDDDSDDDKIIDGAEVQTHQTNPLDSDSDDDVLMDGDELTHNTNPLVPDSDKDGLLDGAEITLGTDPANRDTDGDRLSDGEEDKTGEFVTTQQTGTDPLKPDSDGDELTDGIEVLDVRSNPNVADTDGDGLTDGEEVNTHLTNPLAMDSDDDTLNDKQEIDQGTNPLAADTDSDTINDPVDCAPVEGTIHTLVVQYADADGDAIRENDTSVEACTDGNAQVKFTLEVNGPDNCPAVSNADQANNDGDVLGDACDDAPCGVNANLVDAVCSCTAGFANTNNDFSDGCETRTISLGDVTGDEKVNTGDAIQVLRASLGLRELTADQRLAADVTCDGKVNTGDAIQILRFSLGLREAPVCA